MKRTPVIGITTYHRDEKGFIKLPGQYADCVRRAGGLPLLIQPGESNLTKLFATIDGLLLSGGGDIDPALYADDEHDAVYAVNEERDRFEIELLNKALELESPLFCICRGMQLLNVALGGTLIQDIPDAIENALAHRLSQKEHTQHTITVYSDTRLAKIMQATEVQTASWHHQAIDDIAEDLRATAYAEDGVIEAVELPNNPHLLAVQWHPELTAHEDETQQRLFDAFVQSAAEGTT